MKIPLQMSKKSYNSQFLVLIKVVSFQILATTKKSHLSTVAFALWKFAAMGHCDSVLYDDGGVDLSFEAVLSSYSS